MGWIAMNMVPQDAIRAAAVLAEEVKEENKPLPRPIIWGLSGAIVLFGASGFSCAIGMNFCDLRGWRALGPQDVDEFVGSSRIVNGCWIGSAKRS